MLSIPQIFATVALLAATLAAPSSVAGPLMSGCWPSDKACASFFLPELASHSPGTEAPPRTYRIAGITVDLDEREALRQLRCLSYVGWAEARGEGRLGMEAVMWVVLNRTAAEEFPPDICKVVAQKGQFEVMTRGHGRAVAKAIRAGAVPPEPRLSEEDAAGYREAKETAWGLLTGRIRIDPTGGATHFYAPALQKRLGRAHPAWTKRFVLTQVYRGHNFYKPKAFDAQPDPKIALR